MITLISAEGGSARGGKYLITLINNLCNPGATRRLNQCNLYLGDFFSKPPHRDIQHYKSK
jgi:hypothetical protein